MQPSNRLSADEHDFWLCLSIFWILLKPIMTKKKKKEKKYSEMSQNQVIAL